MIYDVLANILSQNITRSMTQVGKCIKIEETQKEIFLGQGTFSGQRQTYLKLRRQ